MTKTMTNSQYSKALLSLAAAVGQVCIPHRRLLSGETPEQFGTVVLIHKDRTVVTMNGTGQIVEWAPPGVYSAEHELGCRKEQFGITLDKGGTTHPNWFPKEG